VKAAQTAINGNCFTSLIISPVFYFPFMPEKFLSGVFVEAIE